MKFTKWCISQPILIGLIVMAIILSLTPVDDLTFIRETISGGLIIKIFNALIAGLTLMVLVKIATLMRVLFADGKPNGIAKTPIAKAILMGGLYIAFAIVVSNSFG